MIQERIIEIIVYLLQELKRSQVKGNYSNISKKLVSRGYTENEINFAFSWVFNHFQEKRHAPEESLEYSSRSSRVLHEVEKMVIQPEAHGYLLQLRQLGLLDDYEFELVIEKALTLGTSIITIDDIKTIAGSIILGNDLNNQGNWDGFYYPFGSNSIQ
ncbi:hypothetical protein DRI50_00195 [candidate division KSB1 bacterium]|jgi:uncharacterized protein Smg (DUF494 family)|nr:MAG: hypothetical protein DRI50_00195 [candidate division KSB1 bacterium]